MKRAAKGLLLANKILNIITVICLAVMGLSLTIVGAVLFAFYIQESGSPQEAEIYFTIPSFIMLFVGLILLILLPQYIAGLILANLSLKKFSQAHSRKEGRSAGILGIISGVLTFELGIAGGVLALVMKDHHYASGEVIVDEDGH